jgi:hypothetical protein
MMKSPRLNIIILLIMGGTNLYSKLVISSNKLVGRSGDISLIVCLLEKTANHINNSPSKIIKIEMSIIIGTPPNKLITNNLIVI